MSQVTHIASGNESPSYPRQSLRLRVFAGLDNSSQARGNPCLLIPEAPPETVIPQHPATACYSWRKENAVEVRCYTRSGKAIRCCGHGLLAAAHFWQQRLYTTQLELHTGGSRLQSWSDRHSTWLRFPRIELTPCSPPSWLPRLLGTRSNPPLSAAIAGAEDGYLILCWPDNQDLRALPTPGANLAQFSQRAVIYTSAQPGLSQQGIEMRYFAPQYGVPEDTATGSALRVLAEFWSGHNNELFAYQSSREGGALRSRWHRDFIEIGGHCKREA